MRTFFSWPQMNQIFLNSISKSVKTQSLLTLFIINLVMVLYLRGFFINFINKIVH
jgi:hypothetical protein